MNSKNKLEGRIFFLGDDDLGNKIYAVSVKGERGMVLRLVNSFLSIYKIPQDKLYLVDCGISDNCFLLAGRLLLRFNLLAPLGRFFIFGGIKKIYGRLAQLVSEVKDGSANGSF